MVLINPYFIGFAAMDSKIKSDKSSQPDKLFKGSVGVESFRGRLRLRLPRQLFEGRQKYLALGLTDAGIGRKLAEAKAKLIESDIALERFDYTLAKYGHQQTGQWSTTVRAAATQDRGRRTFQGVPIGSMRKHSPLIITQKIRGRIWLTTLT
jgi:Arm DNA-binding domain